MLIKILIGTLILLLLGFFVFRIAVRNDYLKNNRLRSFSSLLEIAFFAIHANALYIYIPVKWPQLPSIPEYNIISIISFIVIGIGLSMVLSSMALLGYKRTMGVESKTINNTGFYKYSRNPQLIGYSLVLIGFCILYNEPILIVWLGTYFIVARWMVQSEEEYLLNKYGTVYKDYCKETPRFLINRIWN